MNLCFFRHGPAVESGTPGFSEESRPLTQEGRRKTRAAARGLKRLDLGLDAVLSSPLPRAHETARIVAEVLGLPRPRLSDLLLPGKPGAQLLRLLKEVHGKSPILVGHEPSLSGAVSLLVSGTGSTDLAIRKAGMAFVELKDATPHPRGTLLMLLAPAALRRLGR
ncbi:MAG: histidine phosphatase family protein [Planctomycetes bacterium]|nr:histidine phosphatase family protein [Planctomycetota bacterium]